MWVYTCPRKNHRHFDSRPGAYHARLLLYDNSKNQAASDLVADFVRERIKHAAQYTSLTDAFSEPCSMILPSAEFARLMTGSLTRTSCSGTRCELWCQTKLASVDPFFIELPAYRQDIDEDNSARCSYDT